MEMQNLQTKRSWQFEMRGPRLYAWETHRKKRADIAQAGCDQSKSLDVIRGPKWSSALAFTAREAARR